jgi:cobalt transporter subunit CbtB
MQPSHTASNPIAATKNLTIIQALFAMAFGLFIIGMVGFSHIEVFHNAAHDTRHSNGFPCH